MHRSYYVVGVALVAVLCLGVPMILFSATDDEPATVSQTQINDLIKRIEKIEARVAELEKKQVLVALTADQIRKPLPKGWVRMQFNGMEYYIIPLDAAQTAATQTAK